MSSTRTRPPIVEAICVLVLARLHAGSGHDVTSFSGGRFSAAAVSLVGDYSIRKRNCRGYGKEGMGTEEEYARVLTMVMVLVRSFPEDIHLLRYEGFDMRFFDRLPRDVLTRFTDASNVLSAIHDSTPDLAFSLL
ncbi:hypothetical protein ONZ45_g15488 [Pleurotus djamor]|nr:hypothetical protein ONZ45_g15488 [Pleurotus djamor]